VLFCYILLSVLFSIRVVFLRYIIICAYISDVKDGNTGEKLTKLTDVGLATLRSACELCNRPDIDSYLSSGPSSVFVHHRCRKSFTRSKDLKKLRLQLEVPQNSPVLCSRSTCFQWKTMCFLCALPADDSADVRRVCTLELGGRILEKCAQRCDDWSLEIRSPAMIWWLKKDAITDCVTTVFGATCRVLWVQLTVVGLQQTMP